MCVLCDACHWLQRESGNAVLRCPRGRAGLLSREGFGEGVVGAGHGTYAVIFGLQVFSHVALC